MTSLIAKTETKELFFDLLKALIEKFDWTYESSDEFIAMLLGQAIPADQLLRLRDGESLGKLRCLALPKISKESATWIPFLWISPVNAKEVAIQLVIAAPGRRFGFRWEEPHGNDGGNHNYYHVQPIKEIRLPDGDILNLTLNHSHIADTFPTIPVEATDPVQLLDAMLVSLYGPTYTAYEVTDSSLRYRIVKHSKVCNWAKNRETDVRSTGNARTGFKIQTRKK